MAVTVRQLKAQCQTLAEDLLQQGQSSAEALRALTPGGSENPKRDTWAWVRYYGQLQLLRGRAQGPDGSSRTSTPASIEDAMILARLAGKPAVVHALAPDGSPATYTVHPKSLAALLHCHARDVVVSQLARAAAAVMDLDVRQLRPELTHEALAEIGRQTRILSWIACTPGPGLPFAEHEREPALPDTMRELDPLTVVEINRAFAKVNWMHLKALEALIAPDPDAGDQRQRPSWSMFVSSLAIELHEDPLELIANRSLASLLASTQLAAAAQREAMAEAKRKSESDRARGAA